MVEYLGAQRGRMWITDITTYRGEKKDKGKLTGREEGGRRGIGKNDQMDRKEEQTRGGGLCGKGSVKFGMSKGRGVI